MGGTDAQGPNSRYARTIPLHRERLVLDGPTPADPWPAALARVVLGLAVETLPVEHRNRYQAEFLAELGDVPQAERTRYSLRVLAGSWTLRTALRNQPRPIEEVIIMGKPLRCRLHLHVWRIRHRPEPERGRGAECRRGGARRLSRAAYSCWSSWGRGRAKHRGPSPPSSSDHCWDSTSAPSGSMAASACVLAAPSISATCGSPSGSRPDRSPSPIPW